MPPTESIKGQRFGMLKAISFAGYFAPSLGADRRAYWTCKCECGKVKRVQAAALKSGKTRSCGCLKYSSNKAIDVVNVMTKS